MGLVATDAPDSQPQSLRFAVRGMTCASCVAHVEKAVGALPGVSGVSVNLPLERADVVADVALAPAIAAAIANEGYEARLVTGGAQAGSERERQRLEQDADQAGLRRATITALLLGIPIMVLEMGGHISAEFHHWQMDALGTGPRWIALALTTLLLLGPGQRFFRLGVAALLRGKPEMNALVALGSGAAYLYSTTATIAPGLFPNDAGHVYFESVAAIIALILLGRWIEARSKGQTGAAITELMALQPVTATRVRDGAEIITPVSEIMVGDVLRVRPGEGLAVDGVVVTGTSFVNEAMLTGEPAPVAKQVGSIVTAGTINGTGALTMKATRVGDETLLAGIIRLVEEAQGAKLPIQGRIDRITGVFVPIVLGLAALTFTVWLALAPPPALPFALMMAVGVLIIACPCAMGLATPISVVVATGRAAQFGVLFRKGEALEQLGKVKVAAFDKTGTLTIGRPHLVHVAPAPGFDETGVIRFAAAIEAGSEHPIARAIVAAADERRISFPPAKSFEATIGMGASAQVEDRRIAIGNTEFMTRCGIGTRDWQTELDARAADGETPILLAVDGSIAALLTVADPIKAEAHSLVAALKAQGLTVAMISGDHVATATAVAERLGITHVVAGVLPAGKVATIEELRSRFGQVMFIGDGLNDAPALAAADIGVAVGDGTTVAIESADVVLAGGRLSALPRAVDLSRATMRNITQNLVWAFGYNIALIPVAAGVLYPALGLALSPMLAAAAMSLSSIFVVLNALRLGRFGATSAEPDLSARRLEAAQA